MPADFFHANRSIGPKEIGDNINIIFTVHPIEPGANQGVGNYVLGPPEISRFHPLHQLGKRNCSFLVSGAERCFTWCLE